MTAPAPLVPRSKSNPTQTGMIERRVNGQLQDKYTEFTKALREYVEALPHRVVERNSSFMTYTAANASRYIYELDDRLLASMDRTIADLILRIVMEGQESYIGQHFFSQAAELGYRSGQIDAVENIQHQLPEYPRAVEFVLTSPQYRSRLSFIGARAFEDFKGFNDQMKSDLRTILVNGMARGQSPMELAKLVQRHVLGDKDGTLKGAAVRAKRLARTEITAAHRRAIWDEHTSATGMGIDAEIMHISALIPGRTRKTHAERHGWTGTVEAEEEWYSKNGNQINCLCTTTTVVTDSSGKPLNQKAVERQMKRREKFLDVAPEPS